MSHWKCLIIGELYITYHFRWLVLFFLENIFLKFYNNFGFTEIVRLMIRVPVHLTSIVPYY